MKKKFLIGILACIASLTMSMGAVPVMASTTYENMYRLYNRNSGEHFYTASQDERNNLITVGWRYEGVAWEAPIASNTPVYRLYNPNSGDHFYTTNSSEKDNLVSIGWTYEGIGWYSDDNNEVPVYREYNPNVTIGTHNYTTSANEDTKLKANGWSQEGISWYGVNETRLDVGTIPTSPTAGDNTPTGQTLPDGSGLYTQDDVVTVESVTNPDGSFSTTYYFE